MSLGWTLRFQKPKPALPAAYRTRQTIIVTEQAICGCQRLGGENAEQSFNGYRGFIRGIKSSETGKAVVAHHYKHTRGLWVFHLKRIPTLYGIYLHLKGRTVCHWEFISKSALSIRASDNHSVAGAGRISSIILYMCLAWTQGCSQEQLCVSHHCNDRITVLIITARQR